MYWPGESVYRRSSMPFMPREETVRGGRMSEASMWVLSEPLITLILMMGCDWPFPFVRPVALTLTLSRPAGEGIVGGGRGLFCDVGGCSVVPVSGRFANRPYVASLCTAKGRVVASDWFCVIRSRICL